jgi:hypothetical protein
VFFPISAGSTLSSKDGLLERLLKGNPDTANTDSPTTDISASIPEVYETTSVTTTVIQVHDAPPMPEAVTAATVSKVQEYLKSVVYGGLDVSLISLGVVASAAGGDAKTRMHNFSILISKLLLHVSFILEEKLCMRKRFWRECFLLQYLIEF